MAEGVEPIFKAPPGSCDCHLHVFGDLSRYPLVANLWAEPPITPLPEYLAGYQAVAKQFGFERMVFTQPSMYGKDNSCMIDAVGLIGENARAIVDVDDNTPDAELSRLHKAGVRGVRINWGPLNRPRESGLSSVLLPRILLWDARCAEMNWMLDLLAPSWIYIQMMDALKKLKSNFTVAHLGMFLPSEVTGSGFRQMVELLRQDTGRCWMKLTGPYRLSTTPGFPEVASIAHALIEARSDRIIWGSDYPNMMPHIPRGHVADLIQLFNLIPDWAPDEAMRRKILVDNPQKLFGF